MAQRRAADAGLNDPARRALLAAAAALPACAAVPGAAPPTGPVPSGTLPAPVARVGDRWRYRIVDRYTDAWVDEPTWEVVEAGDLLRLKISPRRSTPSHALEERFASPWVALTEVVFGSAYPFRDPVPIVPAPLEYGRLVSTATTYVDPAAPRPRRWSQQVRVGGWESVTVPAGRFDCLRIGRTIAYEDPDGGRNGATRSDTLWYAPAVHRWVQRELRGEYVSTGVVHGTAARGERVQEGWQLHQLSAYQAAR
ncbi:MAG: hypothetical protein WCK28_20895 [Burkholderiales bacterium]